jgi:hypothetical protein
MFPTATAKQLLFGDQAFKSFKGINCDGSKSWMQ